MMTDIETRLIQAKTKRTERIKDVTVNVDDYLTLTTNLPGWPKNTVHSRLIIRMIHRLIEDVFVVKKNIYIESDAGDIMIYQIDQSPKTIKQQAIYIEENHPLGRLIDLDVYSYQKPLNRNDFNASTRKCYLCEHPAHQCAVLKRHSLDELHAYFRLKSERYFTSALAETVGLSLRKELSLYPKLGLVSFHDSGIHTDMNKEHFFMSIEALKPYFEDFIRYGLKNNLSPDRLREIGKKAERAMFQATSNINTHKGAIFIFGCFLPFYVKAIVEDRNLTSAIDSMKDELQSLLMEDFDKIIQKGPSSYGETCYQIYRIGGIREEVLKGFPSLLSWFFKEPLNDYQQFIKIASLLDDTTIIKRTSKEVLKRFKVDCENFLKKPFALETYHDFSNYYKAKNVSPGGSADLYALAQFITKTDFLLRKIT